MSKREDVELAVGDGVSAVRAEFPVSYRNIADVDLRVLGTIFVEARMERENGNDGSEPAG